MTYNADRISFLFYFAYCIYSIFTIYIFYFRPRLKVNMILGVLCLGLCIWSLSYAIIASADNYETALRWSKISIFGWGWIFSFLLHFTLVYTGKMPKSKLIYPLIYLPGIICVYIFALSPHSSTAYSLSFGSFGWYEPNLILSFRKDIRWNFFNIYYLFYSMLTLSIMYHYIRTTHSEVDKKRVMNLFLSLIAVVLLGSYSDYIFLYFFHETPLKIAIILILLPIAIIFYSQYKYNFLNPGENSSVYNVGVILTEYSKNQIYLYLTMFYISFSLSHLFLEYFILHKDLNASLLSSLSIAGVGILIQVFHCFNLSETFYERIVLFLVCGSVPWITFSFLDVAGKTAWAFPLVVLVIITLLNDFRFNVYLSISIIATQVAMALLYKPMMLTIGATDYVMRILFFLGAFLFSIFVNRVYIKRLKENKSQLLFQKTVSEISTELMNIQPDNFDQTISAITKNIGMTLESCKCYLLLFSPDMEYARYSYSWKNQSGLLEPLPDARASIKEYPWFFNQILEKNWLILEDPVRDVPAEATSELAFFQRNQIQSLLGVPIETSQQVIGFICIENPQPSVWSMYHKELLKISSHLLSDAYQKSKSEGEINYMAYYDFLTGLPNRVLFQKQLEENIQRAKSNNTLLGVMFVDIDSFKYINDFLGHEGGDFLLKKISNRLKKISTETGMVSRFGGDEFTILFPDKENVAEIHMAAKQVMDTFTKDIVVMDQNFSLTISGGGSVYPQDGSTVDELIKNADVAMYKSKSLGKNQYNLCSPQMKNEIMKHTILTNDLHRALEKDQLYLEYQPQVDIRSGEVIGFEALLRWRHPKLGLIMPSIFIPLAEQSGLIISMGQMVIEKACSQMKKWHDLGKNHWVIAVNLSMKQFKDPNLISIINDTLEKLQLPPHALELEITESIDIHDDVHFLSLLHKLKDIGVKISLDDFGTKYSSLNRLKIMPIDKIKIDIQFVRGIGENPKDEGIIDTIIKLASHLETEVLAEGVENLIQYKFLQDRNCHLIQGYYFHRPLSMENVHQEFIQ